VLEQVPGYLEVLQRGALRLTGHQQDAEDLVQETFLRATRSLHQFEPGSNLRAWLFRIMVNLHRDARRAEGRAPRPVSLEAGEHDGSPVLLETLPSCWPAVEEQALAAYQLGWLRAQLATLPANFATAVELADLEDRSHEEIAEAMGVPRSTVGTRVFRGRSLLRERLRRAAAAERQESS
jgi:RNA polymerase sigma-70 factor (ECF subfamily)